jgi:chaperone BCS1
VYPEGSYSFLHGLLILIELHSGKTSLIHSLAGELGLDIYVVSLSSKGYVSNVRAITMSNLFEHQHVR